MANPEHHTILRQGIETWNEWRKNNPEITPDLAGEQLSRAKLSKVNLSNAILHGTSFTRADLSDANLIGSNLTYANLVDASLSGANLANANLSRAILKSAHIRHSNLNGAILVSADLTDADLRETNLAGSDLVLANFSNVELDGVNFDSARFGRTKLADVDLSKVKGLESVKHEGPSTIGIDTIYRSQGKIPEVFLRGCGIPDTFIEFSRSLVGKPIEFYSCFITHSAKDKHFCERLYADLQANGVRVWYFPEDATWGEAVWGEIDRSIRIYDKLVVVCSKDSLTSGPVLREIERALRREDEERKNILFPITIDDYIFDR